MIVLSGANSMIGADLLPILRNFDQVCAFDTEQGDITDPSFVKRIIDEVKPAYLINCVETSDIEECEYKREQAYRLNGQVPGELAGICREYGVTLVHFSSVFVFNGDKNGSYTEADPADPRTVYGDSKALAEKKIIESGCEYIIFRLPNLIGKNDQFLFPLFQKIATGESIDVIRGQVSSLLAVKDLAVVVADCLQKNIRGIINVANGGSARHFEIILDAVSSYVKHSGRSISPIITEVDYSDYLSPAEWPLNMTLDLSRLQNEGIQMRSWQDALNDTIGLMHQYLTAIQ